MDPRLRADEQVDWILIARTNLFIPIKPLSGVVVVVKLMESVKTWFFCLPFGGYSRQCVSLSLQGALCSEVGEPATMRKTRHRDYRAAVAVEG